MKRTAYILLLLLASHTLAAQNIRTRILFLVDASLSMRNDWPGGSKWATAVNALTQITDSLSYVPSIQMGLRIFGHLSPEIDKDCRDSRLEVAIEKNTGKKIRERLSAIRPRGITPLVYSIERCAYDFGTAEGRNILVVITDGEEACDGDPCSAALALQQNNILLRPFIIGMNLHPESVAKMNCMGKMYNTASNAEFTATLKKIVLESIAKTTLQVNLNDAEGRPLETGVNMSFYDSETGLLKYNFYHTMNARGVPDTFTISPMFNYRLQIHTLPPVIVEDIDLVKDEHNVLNVNAPQGFIAVSAQGATPAGWEATKVKCLVHIPGKGTLNTQLLTEREKYITGTYKVEVLTLPPVIVENVKVSQNKTTTVEIPAPGLLTIHKSGEFTGSILLQNKNSLQKIYDLDTRDLHENIALQPGKYRLVYREKNSKNIYDSVDQEIAITGGAILEVKMATP